MDGLRCFVQVSIEPTSCGSVHSTLLTMYSDVWVIVDRWCVQRVGSNDMTGGRHESWRIVDFVLFQVGSFRILAWDDFHEIGHIHEELNWCLVWTLDEVLALWDWLLLSLTFTNPARALVWWEGSWLHQSFHECDCPSIVFGLESWVREVVFEAWTREVWVWVSNFLRVALSLLEEESPSPHRASSTSRTRPLTHTISHPTITDIHSAALSLLRCEMAPIWER